MVASGLRQAQGQNPSKTYHKDGRTASSTAVVLHWQGKRRATPFLAARLWCASNGAVAGSRHKPHRHAGSGGLGLLSVSIEPFSVVSWKLPSVGASLLSILKLLRLLGSALHVFPPRGEGGGEIVRR